MITVVCVVAGYLAGSMPFGYWIVRLFKGWTSGRSAAATSAPSNVFRTYGPKLGVPVILLDVAKGFVPAFLAAHYVGDLAGVLAGGAAMLGHWRPLFLRFARGGKMVATCGGVVLGVAPLVALAGAALWLAVFLVFRYASLASMVSACALPVLAVLFGEPWPVVAFGALAAVGVVVLHRASIRRLLSGTENRFHLRRRKRAAAGV